MLCSIFTLSSALSAPAESGESAEESFSCFEAGKMWDIYTSIPPAMGMFYLVELAREKAFCNFSLPALERQFVPFGVGEREN